MKIKLLVVCFLLITGLAQAGEKIVIRAYNYGRIPAKIKIYDSEGNLQKKIWIRGNYVRVIDNNDGSVTKYRRDSFPNIIIDSEKEVKK